MRRSSDTRGRLGPLAVARCSISRPSARPMTWPRRWLPIRRRSAPSSLPTLRQPGAAGAAGPGFRHRAAASMSRSILSPSRAASEPRPGDDAADADRGRRARRRRRACIGPVARHQVAQRSARRRAQARRHSRGRDAATCRRARLRHQRRSDGVSAGAPRSRDFARDGAGPPDRPAPLWPSRRSPRSRRGTTTCVSWPVRCYSRRVAAPGPDAVGARASSGTRPPDRSPASPTASTISAPFWSGWRTVSNGSSRAKCAGSDGLPCSSRSTSATPTSCSACSTMAG